MVYFCALYHGEQFQNLKLDFSVDRTYKLYYGGVQKRPDGQYSRPVTAAGGQVIGHVAEASRKDVRNAVEAAQKAFAG